jgi:hypothetical protein
MSETVFILGAGASAHAGAPLMYNFLDRARALYANQKMGPAEGSCRLVFEAISKLQAVHSKANTDLNNLESVLGLFEMAPTLGVGFLSNPEILVPSMQRLIVSTLGECIGYPNQENRRRPPELYFRLSTLVRMMGKAASVITFNYDVALDYAFEIDGGLVDYSLDNDIPPSGGIALLKLHGSANWRRCPECKLVRVGTYAQDRELNRFGRYDSAFFQIRHTDLIWRDCCAKPLDSDPVIVPPIWNKGQHHNSIASVWKRAAKELSEARNIVVVGYSLPETDLFFRHLFALGTVGNNLLERFWVLDPSTAAESRFRQLLGPGALSRFAFRDQPFDGFMSWMAQAFPEHVRAAEGQMEKVRQSIAGRVAIV